jgi:hypothetical protein
MLSTIKKRVRLSLSLALVVCALGLGVPTSRAKSVPRYTLCEYDSSNGITTCDSFGSSAGYFRYQCNSSGSCWAV